MSRIDYDLKQIKGIAFDIDGVLSPATVPLGHEGLPNRMVNLHDGYAIHYAAKHGLLHLAIISGARASGIEMRYTDLGVPHVVMGAKNKLEILKSWMADCGLEAGEVAFVGDDVPDLEPMRFVGLAVAPCDASADALAVADYISPCNGGYGVGRDLIEQVLRAQKSWPVDDEGFGWNEKP